MFGRGGDHTPTETCGTLHLDSGDHSLNSGSDPQNVDGIQGAGVFGVSLSVVLGSVLFERAVNLVLG